MGIAWDVLLRSQRAALLALRKFGPCDLLIETGEQLQNLGLAEKLVMGGYCITPLGQVVTASRTRSRVPVMRPGYPRLAKPTAALPYSLVETAGALVPPDDDSGGISLRLR